MPSAAQQVSYPGMAQLSGPLEPKTSYIIFRAQGEMKMQGPLLKSDEEFQDSCSRALHGAWAPVPPPRPHSHGAGPAPSPQPWALPVHLHSPSLIETGEGERMTHECSLSLQGYDLNHSQILMHNRQPGELAKGPKPKRLPDKANQILCEGTQAPAGFRTFQGIPT